MTSKSDRDVPSEPRSQEQIREPIRESTKGPWRSYKEIVSQLATRIVDAQKPIRVLQAIRWDDSVEHHFVKSKYRELPKFDYDKVELGFDPRGKVEELDAI